MAEQEIVPDSRRTLFLDRDGVINRRITGDYVKRIEEFDFLEGVLDALRILSREFHRIVVVTNQQGIAKGVMSEADLATIHGMMLREVSRQGGRIDAVYHCPDLEGSGSNCRKPAVGMALKAQADYPEIDFHKSVMIGDSVSDMQFAEALGMKKIFIGDHEAYECYPSLWKAALSLVSNSNRLP